MEKERLKLAEYNKKGIPMLLSVILYWAAMLGMQFYINHPTTLALLYLCGTVLLFPAGYLFCRLMGINMLKRINSLTSLTGLLAAGPVFTAPIMVYIYINDPAALPFTISTITAVHFFPFAWLYKSYSYLYIPIAIILLVSASLIFLPNHQFAAVPIIMLCCNVILLAASAAELRSGTVPGTTRDLAK
ncbi:hypothetical protein GJU40_16935 [Bacillus lacus]|uniref:Uncharacterized protein n=1 Tax=Metabacillus lacus TaxID=1983721 RepID=A0A7X2J1W7_9BACI|nr:hypothetical protein [Metabacillus lacus]MRX73830.1 hypothetical protein [Metabacillus lacus]